MKTNQQKAKMIAEQYKPCSKDFYDGIYQGALLTLNTESPEKDVIWPIRMSKTLKNEFKNYCDKQGYSMNKRIKMLIEKDIEHEKTNI